MDSKIIKIQRLLNALWKVLMLYLLNIDVKLNFKQVLPLFRQKQILRYNKHKNLQKQNNEDFFIQLLNGWLNFTDNKFPAEEILDQPIQLNPYTKLKFSSDNLCFYCITTKNISDNYNQRSLQIPSTRSNLLYDI